jgi:hypothetical protein
MNLIIIRVILLAPNGKLRLVISHSWKGVEAAKSDPNPTAKHQLVSRPSPIVNAAKGGSPAIVGCIRRNTRDPTSPQTSTRRKGLPRPEQVKEFLGLTLGNPRRSKVYVAFDNSTNSVRPRLYISSAILRKIGRSSQERGEWVALLTVGGQELFTQPDLRWAAVDGGNNLHGFLT